jgi:hypothetical protein
MLALLLVPAALGGIATASAGQPDTVSPALYQLPPGHMASPAVELSDWVRCNGNDCNHDGGPNDRRQQWRAQPQPWGNGGWNQGNNWNNGRNNAWDNDWQNRGNAWNNGGRNNWQNGRGNGWNNGYNNGWQRHDDRNYRRNWRSTGQRQACLNRHASHEDCSQLPW